MINKRGFTITELLAVIVILSIIALIAYPFVINVIFESKKAAEMESVNQLVKAAEIHYNDKMLTDGYSIQTESYNDIISGVNGKKPDEGTVYYNKNGEVAISVRYGNNCYLKSYDSENITITTGETCELPFDYMVKTEDGVSETSMFLNGPIRRNKIESITTVDYINTEESIGSWDVSSKQNGSIIAWYKDDDADSLYEVYIGSDDVVRTNPDSSKLFVHLINLTSYDFSNVSTTITTNMKSMFGYNLSLEYLDLSNFNTSNVTDMSYMFASGNINKPISIKEIKGLENFDTSKVVHMKTMFQFCANLEYLDLSNWDTSNVTAMNNMFYLCENLKNISFGEKFITSNVENMQGMFYNCFDLTELDLSSFDTSKVSNMSFMFAGASDPSGESKEMSLKNIKNINNFNTSNVTTMFCMFQNCANLEYLDLSQWNTSKVVNMMNMFAHCNSLKNINLTDFETNNVTNMEGMFSSCYSLTSLDLSSFDTSKVIGMGCIELTGGAAGGMFKNCYNLISITFSEKFNTSKVTNMSEMFDGCSSLTSLDLSSFDTSSVTDMRRMFALCENLTNLDLSSFDTPKVTDMIQMFAGAIKLDNINFSKAKFTRVSSYNDMFNNTKLTNIIVYDSNAQTFINSRLSDVGLTGVSVVISS